MAGRNKHYTLCYYCAKATKSGCSWSKEFKPVDGWNAKKADIGLQGYRDGRYYTYYVDSYVVYRCPEFVEHELCKTNPLWRKELDTCLSFEVPNETKG